MNIHVDSPVDLGTHGFVADRKADFRRKGIYAGFGKPALDRLLILVALPVVLPLIAVLAVLASLDGHAPFYRQKRVGRDGRVFRLLKVRTMVPDADDVLEEHLADNPDAREEWDHLQKLRQDPRVTRLGALIRKTSMDELPQLWNVLCGHMSLVGPRPMLPEQKKMYPGAAYYRMRPGITGLWQITDRNDTSFADRAIYDTEYFRRLSLREDLRILMKTVRVVIRGTGC